MHSKIFLTTHDKWKCLWYAKLRLLKLKMSQNYIKKGVHVAIEADKYEKTT